MTILMKYEFRKQLTSKIILLSIIIVMEFLLLFGMLIGNRNFIIITNVILIVSAIFSIIYVFAETAVVFENDLSKKQGYLLFMTPNSITSIVGSKVITGAIQVTLFFSLIVALFVANDKMLSVNYGYNLYHLEDTFNAFGDVGFSFMEFIVTTLMLLLFWVDTITLAFLVTSISYSFLSKGIVNTFFSILLFAALLVAELLIAGSLVIAPFDNGESVKVAFVIFSVLFFAIPAAFNYIATVMILDKKVSL